MSNLRLLWQLSFLTAFKTLSIRPIGTMCNRFYPVSQTVREIYGGRAVGVGVGVGATEADGSGEGDCPGGEKFGPRGLLLGNGT